MSIGLHPHIIGRAFRARAIREFLDYAKTFDGVWWATREEIADWYLQNHKAISAETLAAIRLALRLAARA